MRSSHQTAFDELLVPDANGAAGRPRNLAGWEREQKAKKAKARREAISLLSDAARKDWERAKRRDWDTERYARVSDDIIEKAKQYYKKNSVEIAEKSKKKYYSNPKKSMLYRAREAAKHRGHEFNLTEDDLVIPEFCPVLGIKLQTGPAHGRAWNYDRATLDRVDNSKGYIRGNVRVISWRANRLKADGTLHDFERIVDYIKGHRL